MYIQDGEKRIRVYGVFDVKEMCIRLGSGWIKNSIETNLSMIEFKEFVKMEIV